jgi:integrase/recombinase XerD
MGGRSDYDNKLIHIQSSKEYRVKFGKDHTTALSDPLCALLKQIEKYKRENGIESDYIFTDENGNRLTERKVRESIKEAREIADLGEHVTMHAMRRTSGTKLRQNGESLNTIKGTMNHSDERTTSRYLGVPRDDAVAALNKLNIPDFLPINKRLFGDKR